MKKPNTSAHHTSQPIRKASRRPCQMTSSTVSKEFGGETFYFCSTH
ncbi:MAG: hypothetical protein JO243_12795 [Solirubrobacterales bacterium]|nr:hypothetical protein [Solirubrobacterales bacterium]